MAITTIADYEGAVAALSGPAHQAASKDDIVAAAARRTRTVRDMHAYMSRCGMGYLVAAPTTSAKLTKVVHITGTKGKGSTAAMCERILRNAYGCRTGLFTSPHLVDVRERIRVDGRPVSRGVFAQAYWTIRRGLEQYCVREYDDENDDDALPTLPGYFRMLTLTALYIFGHYDPPIDAIVLEVGMGGRYDATNVLDHDAYDTVCGVALIDYDHTRVLGDTLEKIAWEKGGIFVSDKANVDRPARPETAARRRGCIALASNTPGVLSVLGDIAASQGAELQIVRADESAVLPPGFEIGLAGRHQLLNAELALALCQALMSGNAAASSSEPPISRLCDALAHVSWPGRCQTLRYNDNMTLRLDGAHTACSVKAGRDWFLASCAGADRRRVLLFGCGHERSPVTLLELLRAARFDRALFCRPDAERPSAVRPPTARELWRDVGKDPAPLGNVVEENANSSWQDTLKIVWAALHCELNNSHQQYLEAPSGLTAAQALEYVAANEATPVDVFVTGSLYLVGSVLGAVGWTEDAADGCLRHR